MQRIYSENPPSFRMYKLTKLEACSEPSQIPKVDLSAIAVFNGFSFRIMFMWKFHSHLHTLHLHFGPGYVLMNFLNSNNEVVD